MRTWKSFLFSCANMLSIRKMWTLFSPKHRHLPFYPSHFFHAILKLPLYIGDKHKLSLDVLCECVCVCTASSLMYSLGYKDLCGHPYVCVCVSDVTKLQALNILSYFEQMFVVVVGFFSSLLFGIFCLHFLLSL